MPEHDPNMQHPTKSRVNFILLCFLAIAGFFLLAEHRAHLFGWLPFLLLLACPFMHLFMHGGHGGHAHDDQNQSAGDKQ